MKLDTKKTLQIGCAFLAICSFWQMYNSIIPLILTNTFHMNETVSGVIMALDNVLALFMLPFFGGLSDKTNTKIGRRKPFILFGTIAAVILSICIPIIDNSYFENPTTGKLALFIGVLGALLVAMGTYRSPAVALMPDCVPKPLRSRANAIINLMGAIGGVLYLAVAAVLYPNGKTSGMEHVNYMLLFMVVIGVMLVALVIVMVCVDEVELHRQMQEYEAAHPEENLAETDDSGNEILPKEVKVSLAMLLLSIAGWFISFNAMETWFTTYAVKMWGMSLGGAAFCMLVANGGAIITYIPSGILASKIGRKKTILLGIVLMMLAYFLGFIVTMLHPSFTPFMYVIFVGLGIGWAFINVNSLPMVVEMCKGSDIGKFTGLYYTFSMSAQIVTPILAGWFLSNVSYLTLFPYAFIFTVLAFITMQFVNHGDSEKVEAKKGLEACLAHEIEIVAIARKHSARSFKIPVGESVTLIEADLEDLATLDTGITDCDAFFHFGWGYTARESRDNLDLQMANVAYCLDAVRLANRMGCSVFVGAGSQAEYGIVTEEIFPDTEPNPVVAYGKAKLEAGRLSIELCKNL